MLQCDDIAKHSSDYINHDLSIIMRLKMGIHIRLCRCCQGYLQQFNSTILTVKTVKPKEAGSVTSQNAALKILNNIK